MHLTTQHIEFIDTYLKHSGVEYVDIRFEMTDHIATALEAQEGDFLEQFRLYMARNKKHLMQNNRSFAKQARRRAFKILLQGMLKPYFILIAIALFFIYKGVVAIEGGTGFIDILSYIYLAVVGCAGLYFQFTFKRKRSKFSVVDKLISILLLTNYIIFFVFRPGKMFGNTSDWVLAYYAFFTTFFGMSLYGYIVLRRKYERMYHA